MIIITYNQINAEAADKLAHAGGFGMFGEQEEPANEVRKDIHRSRFFL